MRFRAHCLRRLGRPALLILALLGALGGTPDAAPVAAGGGAGHEVWIVDQADTGPESGGTLYIYEGSALAWAATIPPRPEVIDLAGEAASLCEEQTGTAARRPHMLLFNADQTYAVLSYVATGHVLFIHAPSRTPVACIDVGMQAHAAFPTADQRFVIVANQNGKLLQRITTDYANGSFVLDDAATINLATCVTPSGAPCEESALRPDNAPICPVLERSSRFSFVTLRGGGLLVVNIQSTPMSIVAEYDRSTIHPNGCGGVEGGGKVYLNSGGGTPSNPFEADLYALPLSGYSMRPNPPNTPQPRLVFSHDSRGDVDSHGAVLTANGRYVWVADRSQDIIVVVDVRTDQIVSEIPLAGPWSDAPAPDLLDIAPGGARIYASLRGPNPLTANVPDAHNAEGTTPGLAVIRVEAEGRAGTIEAIVPIGRQIDGQERADPHAIRVRRR